MIEDAINRLAAAIEKQAAAVETQTAIMLKNQEFFERILNNTGSLVAGAKPGADPITPEPEKRTRTRKQADAKVEPTPEPETDAPAPTPTTKTASVAWLLEQQRAEENAIAESGTRPVNRDDLKDLAMSLSRQDSKFVPDIKAAITKHGVKSITALPDDKIGEVFAELNALANKHAREG